VSPLLSKAAVLMAPSPGACSIAYWLSRTSEIVGISGTSAGAMNAAVLADGLRRGGRWEARAALASYWDDVGGLPGYASFEALPVPGALRSWHLDSNPMFLWMDMLARIWSPYQTNPCNYNPLRALLERIDFEGLRRDQNAPRVFIGATNVRSGLRRVFDNSELSVDVLLASACLPLAYQAVEIGGEHYWDGGYTGNPPLAPLYLRTTATDVVIIGITPLLRADVPRTAREIISRIDEISFNSAFISELAAVAFIEQMFEPAAAKDRVKRMFMHMINDKALDTLGASSKMNNERAFLERLRKISWSAAEHWLEVNLRSVGERSTVDLSGLLPLQDGLFTDPIGIRQRLQTSDQIVRGTH
jgi:NTE family protein